MDEKNQSVWMEERGRYEGESPWGEENVSGRSNVRKHEENTLVENSAKQGRGGLMASGSAQPGMENAIANESVQPGTENAMASGSAQPGMGNAMASGIVQPGMENTMANGDVQPGMRSAGLAADGNMQPEMRSTLAGGSARMAVENHSAGVPSSGTGRPVQGNSAHEDTEETKRLKENFGFFGPAAFLYAVFYVFCTFRNDAGVTYPFFVGGSLLFMCLSLSKLGITLKKGSKFYMAAMILLGISTFCTDDAQIIAYNKLGGFLLMMSLLLKQFCNTEKWKLGKYLGSICVMVVASVGELNRPVADASAYKKSGGRKMDKRVWYVGLGLLVGVPLMLVVLLLLASADAVFRQMTKGIPDSINLYNTFSILWRIVFVYFVSYAFIAWLCGRKIKDEVVDRRTGEPVVAITITGLLTMLYLLFSGIQIGALFLGKLRLPAGYTYAMYAREGFFQLLGVSILNLIIVLVCMSYFRESKVLKVILIMMSLCTFVMIASSAMRMIIYIRYYYLTYLRILVLWALALLAVLFVGVVINIMKDTFPFFRYSVAVVTVLYLALSFAHPDYIIARVNVANASHSLASLQLEQGRNQVSQEHMENSSQKEILEGSFFLTSMPYQDYSYLRELSADAAPILVPYLEELGYEMEAFYAEDAVSYAREQGIEGSIADVDVFGYYWMRHMQRTTENFNIRTYNVSRHMALNAFRQQR